MMQPLRSHQLARVAEEYLIINESTTGIEIVPLPTGQDVLTEVLRDGARRMPAQAIEAHAHLEDEAEHKQVVRNGHLPERTIRTGLGPIEVQQPGVRGRRLDGHPLARSAWAPRHREPTRPLHELARRPGIPQDGGRIRGHQDGPGVPDPTVPRSRWSSARVEEPTR